MGIKRIVDTSFWTDGKVDEFTPEDKYFMLYLLTNPFSTQLGIYEISIKQVAFQLGYSPEATIALIDRFQNKYGMIIYSKETNEIAIKNFLRHSIVKGGAPVRDCLIKELKKVKNRELIKAVFSHLKGYETINATVKGLISDYEEKNGELRFSNEKENENVNDNENENENEVSYPVSYNDTYNDSFPEPPAPVKKPAAKRLYGVHNNVNLSEAEYARLKAAYPDSYISKIDRLSIYMQKTGKKYDDHFQTIKQWAKEDDAKAAAGNANPFMRMSQRNRSDAL